MNLCWSK